jgi:hypothetical protein
MALMGLVAIIHVYSKTKVVLYRTSPSYSLSEFPS